MKFKAPIGYSDAELDTKSIKAIVVGRYKDPNTVFGYLKCHKLITDHGNYLVELNRYSMADFKDE